MTVAWQTEPRQAEEAGWTGVAAQGPLLLLYELRQVTAPLGGQGGGSEPSPVKRGSQSYRLGLLRM